MPQRRPRPPRPSHLRTTQEMLQAWADGRIGWWEVMWWSEDGSFAAIAAAAREAGITWPPSRDGGQDSGVEPVSPIADYETQFVGWADQQANLLLRHLAGDPHAARAIDWANVADEIADVAKGVADDGEAHLTRGLAYVAKLAAEPDHPAAQHWREAAAEFICSASCWLDQPDIYELASLESAWFAARRIARFDLGLITWHPSWPDTLPFTLSDILAERFDPAVMARQLQQGMATGR